MAFMGANEVIAGKKNLLNDHCLSDYNLKNSEWPDFNVVKPNAFGELQRINKDVQTKAINLVLEWSTEDDLDLHALCGCGIWTDTPAHIQCKHCGMKRDVDMRQGKKGRRAVEHVFFPNPAELQGKVIGCYVQNYQPGNDDKDVEFTVYALNRYEVVIWPERKVQKVTQEEWMTVGY